MPGHSRSASRDDASEVSGAQSAVVEGVRVDGNGTSVSGRGVVLSIVHDLWRGFERQARVRVESLLCVRWEDENDVSASDQQVTVLATGPLHARVESAHPCVH